MKKFLLTTASVLTILFAQAQIQCQSNFSYMQNGPTTVFADLSTITPGWSTNYSVSWLWDFGDGITSTLQNPSHTYINGGIYTVGLTTLNQYGSNNYTEINYINIMNMLLSHNSSTNYSIFYVITHIV